MGFETVIWAFIVDIMGKKLQVVMLIGVPTVVLFRNLERTSKKAGMKYFPSLFFFFFF